MNEKIQTTVKDLGPCRKKLTVVIPPDRVRREIEEGFENAGKQLRIPGFRAGHVPRKIVEQRYGEAIRREIKEMLIQDSYREAVEDQKLAPLGSPTIDFDKITFGGEAEVRFEVELDVRPAIELKNYKGVQVAREKVTVSPQEVDEQVRSLKRQIRRPVAYPEGSLGEEGFAICRVQFLESGKAVLQREAVRIAPQTPVVGSDPEGFRKAMVGKKKGESLEVPMTFPEDFEVEGVRGKPGHARLTLTEVYRFHEPTDEEMLRAFDFPSLDTMRQETEKTILAHKNETEDRRIEEAILSEIIGAHDFELPERIVEEQVESSLARFRALREAAGAKPEEVAAEVAARRKDSRKNAEKQVMGFFLIEAIGRKEKLFVTDDEIKAELQAIAARNQSSLQEVLAYYEQQNLLPMLRMELLESNVRRFLRENAKVS